MAINEIIGDFLESDYVEFDIEPCSKPRQTRSDKWKKRPCVVKYREFADECREREMDIARSGTHVLFIVPMPKSWSKKKKALYHMSPMQSRPDVDNLAKAVLDSIFKEDCEIWDLRITKVWGMKGKILIKYK